MAYDPTQPAFYVSQSPFTDPGIHRSDLDAVPADLQSIRDAASQLVFHYRADGDWDEHGIAPERISEINTRYADDMLRRLFELRDGRLDDRRPAHQRLVGCCRDFTVLFLALARHHGIPARMRVGFAAYFMKDWYLDHVVAEVWDAAENRWRLVDAELADGHRDPNDDSILDPLDVPRDRFLVGPDTWNACRAGEQDPERFVVHPEIDNPMLRSWAYLRHNLVLDLAALNKREMVLWDVWGIDDNDELSDAQQALLNEVASADGLAATERLFAHEELRVPPVVLSFSPENPVPPREVALRS